MTMNIDYWMFQQVNQLAERFSLLDQLMAFFTEYGPMLLVAMLVWIFLFNRGDRTLQRQTVLLALAIVALAIGLNKCIELFYFRSRPFVTHDVILLIEKSAKSTSFPSNHSAGAFAIAFAFLWKRRKFGIVLLGVAVLMAFSRVFVGVHYPADVLTGALIALIATAILKWQSPRLEQLFSWGTNLLLKRKT